VGAGLVVLREGFEASLVVGIVLAFLNRTGRRDGFWPVWLGAGAALLLSFAAGALLFAIGAELEGAAGKAFEGSAMLVAAGLLTWMIFWMRKQAGNIKSELEAKLASAIAAGSAVGLASVVFFAVLREGWETALFLFAVGESSTPVATLVGAVIGLTISISLGVALFMGSRRLNLRQFFTATGILLIVFAAGLLAHAVLEFQEASLLPQTIEHVWNTNGVVSENSHLGKFLTALFGYNSDPSALEVGAWILFLTTALTFFLRPLVSWHRSPAPARG
jgi:high-affinity iron transporter